MSFLIKSTAFLFLLLTILTVSSVLSSLSAQEIVEVNYLEKDDGLAARKVNHVIRDVQGYFYLFSDNNIQRYDGSSFSTVEIGSISKDKRKPSNITEVYLENDNIVIRLSDTKALYFIESGKLIVKKGLGLANRIINGITATEKNPEDFGQIKTVVHNNRKYLWSNKTIVDITASKEKIIHTFPHSTADLRLINFDKAGNMIAAYSSMRQEMEYLYVLTPDDKVYDYSYLLTEYNTILDIQSDDVLYKWMLVGYNGIKIISLKRDGVQFVEKIPGISKGQFGNIITGIKAHKNQVLFNTETKRHYLYDLKTSTHQEVLENVAHYCSAIGSIKYNPYRSKWFQMGINHTNLTEIYEYDSDLKNATTHEIHFNYTYYKILSENEMWLGGYEANSKKGKLVHYNLKTKKSVDLIRDLPPIKHFYSDTETGQTWIGTTGGLFIYDKSYKKLAQFDKNSPQSNYIFKDDIKMITKYNDKLMACSNGGGIYIIDPHTLTLEKNLSEYNGLSNNIAVACIVDDNNHCWVSTYNGLNAIDTTMNVVKKIYEHQGLPSREFNTQAVAKDDTGQLYFGTLNGLCIIDPVKTLQWKESYKLAINKISTGAGPLTLENDKISTYDSADSLVIDYTITDYFSYPYAKPSVTVNSSTNNRINNYVNQISLTGIKPGELQLSLKPENAEAIQLGFQVKKDYSLLLNLFFLFTSIVLLAGLISYKVIDYIKKRESEKTRLNKKISELELSALQGQMNPHFIFNALGSIQYFIQTSNIEKADAYLSDFAVLMRGILESSKRKTISLRDEVKLLKLYIGLEKTRFENKFDVVFQIDEQTDLETHIPPMILQPHIENAINHGLHHLKDKKGRLEILIEPTMDHLQIIIRDNGIGRKAAASQRINKSHKSRGMDIISERISVLNTTGDIKIKIDTKDLYVAGKATGTEVLIVVKD